MAIIDKHLTDKFAIYNSDCLEVLPSLPEESIDFTVYSPPFPQMFAYSNDPRDMSNCTTYQEGLDQYQFIVNEVHRLTKPGRLTAVHCMDLPKSKLTKHHFPGDIVKAHIKAGFHYDCMITIWKDPWLIARRTRMKTLRHMDLCRDSAQVQAGPADYIMVFIKGGQNAEPVAHPNGLNTYAGETEMPEHLVKKYSNYTGDQKKNLLSHCKSLKRIRNVAYWKISYQELCQIQMDCSEVNIETAIFLPDNSERDMNLIELLQFSLKNLFKCFIPILLYFCNI